MFWEDMSTKKASFKVAAHVGETNNVVLSRARMLHDKVLDAQVHLFTIRKLHLYHYGYSLCCRHRRREKAMVKEEKAMVKERGGTKRLFL